MMKKVKYDVSFNFNIIFPKSRISGKSGKIEIETNGGEIDIEAAKKDQDLIGMIATDVQSHYKTGQVFSLDITNIEKLKHE